jgi:predicted amidophosphoribosyltransferase
LASAKNDEERLALIDKAFVVNPAQQHSILGKNILIVDDVITTGSTLATCAKQLKQTGAKKIWAVAVAHEG